MRFKLEKAHYFASFDDGRAEVLAEKMSLAHTESLSDLWLCK